MRISDWSSDVCSSDLTRISPDAYPECIEWALENGAVLHQQLRFQIQSRLDDRPPSGAAFAKLWRVLTDEWYSSALSRKWTQAYPTPPLRGRPGNCCEKLPSPRTGSAGLFSTCSR